MIVANLVKFQPGNIYIQAELKTNLPKQYFQKRSNLTRPEVTKKPKVTPNIYKVINKKIKRSQFQNRYTKKRDC